MKNIIVCLAFVCCFISCNKCEFHYIDSCHVVDAYVGWSAVGANVKMSDAEEGAFAINLDFDGGTQYYSAELEQALGVGADNDLDRFNALASKNGDGIYNWRPYYTPGYNYNKALAGDIVSIEIVSDADYDERHPAGTSLSDLVQVAYSSYADFLAAADRSANPCFASKQLRFMLDQMPDGGMSAIVVHPMLRDVILFFTEKPTLSRQHRFSVTVTDDSGRACSVEVPLDMDQGE